MDILILIGAFIGIVIILLTKYWQYGALLSLVSFISHFIFWGSGNMLHLIVLLVGLLLMGLELFLPSFGVIGIIGMALSVLGLYLTSYSPLLTLFNVTVALCVSMLLAWLLLKLGYKFQLGKELVLSNALNKESGYQSHQQNYNYYLNKVGYTTTNLRPVGRANFDGEDIEVLSVGEMIFENEQVIVYKIEGSKVFVKVYSK